MAKIIKGGSNDLKKAYKKHWIKSVAYLVFALASLPLAPFTYGLTLIFFGIFGFLYGKNKEKAKILFAGLEGEKKSSKLLKKLPNPYYVIPGPRIQVDGQESEMDHIIIGPNGIFVMETKNYNGRIVGSEKDNNLTQYKVGRGGGRYTKTFYNPIKQVNTHVYRLSKLLKKYGYGQWVQGMVLFTNLKAEVNIKSNSIPVFNVKENGTKKVLNYITKYKSKANLDSKRCNEIVEFINESTKNRR